MSKLVVKKDLYLIWVKMSQKAFITLILNIKVTVSGWDGGIVAAGGTRVIIKNLQEKFIDHIFF